MIDKIILRYYEQVREDEHHRYRSWEHCYRYFKAFRHSREESRKDFAVLHLAFYLASWGMYRGASFLLQKDYKVHNYAVDVLMDPKLASLWDLNIKDATSYDMDLLFELKEAINKSYINNIEHVKGVETTVNVSDTLSSKIILGTLGCVPAYDRYFIAGAKHHGLNCREFNRSSLLILAEFYSMFEDELRLLSERTKADGMEYPAMKLIDMYFWQVGYILDEPTAGTSEDLEVIEAVRNKCRENLASFKHASGKVAGNITRRTYSKTVLEMVTEAIEHLGDKFTRQQIRDYVCKVYGDVNVGTIDCYILSGSVNRNARTNWYYNKKERVANGKYDILYDLRDGYLEPYSQERHGVWVIKFTDGKYHVERSS